MNRNEIYITTKRKQALAEVDVERRTGMTLNESKRQALRELLAIIASAQSSKVFRSVDIVGTINDRVEELMEDNGGEQ